MKNKKISNLILESLEDRLLMSVNAYAGTGRTIVIETTGDSRVDTYYANNHVIVQDSMTGTVVDRFYEDTFQMIWFLGGSGNDNFNNGTDLPSLVFGGAGNDTLRGGPASDVLYGGTGDDSLIGLEGNDNLYGEAGKDTLNGGSGLDGLFGGGFADEDSLYGGSDGDRFLLQGTDVISDQRPEDAVIRFQNSTTAVNDTDDGVAFTWAAASWTDSDILKVDKALTNLHHINGNARLLQQQIGGKAVDQTFIRLGEASIDTSIAAWNSGNGTMSYPNNTFTSDAWLYQVIYHEVGHNWDEVDENPYTKPFHNLSGWVEGDPGTTRPTYFLGIPIGTESTHLASTQDGDNWYYHRDADFARDYGKFNPREDFATSFAYYFMHKYHDSSFEEVSYKHASIDNLFSFVKETSAPTLQSPQQAIRPTLTWSATQGASRYELWVVNRETGNRVIHQGNLTGTSYATNLVGGSYLYYVRSYDSNGVAGAWSSSKYFALANTPGTVSLTGPTGNTTDLTPTFEWAAASDADSYELWVNDANGNKLLHQSGITGTSFTVSSDMALGNYTFWVRAHNNAGLSGDWSDSMEFTIEALKPDTATLIGPSSSSTENMPTFTWHSAENAEYYNIYILNHDTNAVINTWVHNVTEYKHDTALDVGNYTFWVRTWGVGEYGDWSQGMNFEVELLRPDTAILIGPNGSSTDNMPTFTWHSAENAEYYNIYILNQDTNAVINTWVHNVTEYKHDTFLAAGNYQFWVRTWGVGEYGDWSQGMSFEIELVIPDTAVLTGPSGSSTDNMPTFTWKTAENAEYYNIYILNHDTNAVINTWVHNLTEYTHDAALEVGNYTFWVRTWGVGEFGSWSEGMNFEVELLVPDTAILTGPYGSSTNQRPTFTWKAAENAEYYNIYTLNHGTGAVINTWVHNVTEYKHDTFLEAGNYTFWVRTWGVGEYGSWSEGMKFEIEMVVPDTAILTGPSGSSSDHTPTFTWKAADHAEYYNIYIHNKGTGAVINTWVHNVTEYTHGTALETGSYQFWVRTWGVGQFGSWSESMEFEITKLETPTITGPAKFDVSWRPEFTWKAVERAVRYELWVKNLTTGQGGVIYKTDLTGTSYKPTMEERLSDGKFAVHMRAIDEDGLAGDWSGAYEFDLGPRPAPALKATVSGKTLTVNWQAPEGATDYELYLIRNPNGENKQVDYIYYTVETTYSSTQEAGEYLFMVRAYDGLGNPGTWANLNITIV